MSSLGTEIETTKTTAPYQRRVQSFVRREGRLTRAQQAALDDLLPRWQWPARCTAPATVFERDAPTWLEIGFGAGENLLAQCQAEPEHNFIGLEVHRPGVGQLLHRANDAAITNLRVASFDATEFLDDCLPEASLDGVQIWFPDPWPKKRHHKRRIVQPENLQRLARVLKPGGLLLLATDWEHYALWMLEQLQPSKAFENLGNENGFAARCERRIVTRFEARGLRLGHQIFDLAYRRR